MAVLEVLAEVVGAKELLGQVALAELVGVVEVFGARVPVRPRLVAELLAAVAADVDGGDRGRAVEGRFRGEQGGAGPRVAAQVEGVLVPLGFVLVLESVRAVEAAVLFLGFMSPVKLSVRSHRQESPKNASVQVRNAPPDSHT